MTAFVALLRAVNVGGRKLIMNELKGIADGLKLDEARTYIASGNLLFRSARSEASVKGLVRPSPAALVRRGAGDGPHWL